MCSFTTSGCSALMLPSVANAARHFGVTANRDDYAAALVTTLRLPSPFHLTHGVRNPIAAWLDELGLYGKRSYGCIAYRNLAIGIRGTSACSA